MNQNLQKPCLGTTAKSPKKRYSGKACLELWLGTQQSLGTGEACHAAWQYHVDLLDTDNFIRTQRSHTAPEAGQATLLQQDLNKRTRLAGGHSSATGRAGGQVGMRFFAASAAQNRSKALEAIERSSSNWSAKTVKGAHMSDHMS